MEDFQVAVIEPAILIWARERISITLEILSQKTGIAVNSLRHFENGTKYPTFPQLRKLSSFFKMNISVFFLTDPPATGGKNRASLRRLAGEGINAFSTELKSSILEILSKREEMIELQMEKVDWPILQLGRDDTPDLIRGKIKLPFDLQRSWKDPRIAFNSLRGIVEALGILVFQVNGIKLGEMRACAIYDDPYPVIILNRSDSYHARIFSIAHELYHIVRKDDDILISGSNDSGDIPDFDNEIAANRFAINFLVPKDIYDHYLKGIKQFRTKYEFIGFMSRDFGVSKEAISRKLLDDGIIEQNQYDDIRTEGIENAKRNRKSGMVMPYINSISLLGKPFVRTVIENLERKKIDKGYACDLLDIKTKWLSNLIQSL